MAEYSETPDVPSEESPRRKNLFVEKLVERMAARLEAQAEDWKPGWSILGSTIPRNFCTKKPYRGVNMFMLTLMDAPSPWWLTFKQALSLGGCVRKGEHGVGITFYAPREDENGKRGISIRRYYTVFNLTQVDGLPPPAVALGGMDTDAKADEVVSAWALRLRGGLSYSIDTAMPYYHVTNDLIVCPPRQAFKDRGVFYTAIFHEITHSTGAEGRLGRFKSDYVSNVFGTLSYAEEELVAEMGSALFCAAFGVESEASFANSAAYLRGWAQKIKREPKLATLAMGAAQKAFDHVCDATGISPFGQPDAESVEEETATA